jgi:cytochrome c553
MWPNLAGQKKGYLVLQIKAYKSGQRKDAMMMPMVKGLSEVDIEDIAAYYSSMTP